MSTESLIGILEQIRDQQQQQITNFERALGTQREAIEIQRRSRRTLLLLIIMPWVMVLSMLIILVMDSFVS